ncbi:hypothetical protein A45J_2515 [hot springs metagenome]|uniref:Uncharacterized protein n=1 Tax=hot springs metagenome TaxID=433727 RepID=A0A5J4L7A1_9ZZZZ
MKYKYKIICLPLKTGEGFFMSKRGTCVPLLKSFLKKINYD